MRIIALGLPCLLVAGCYDEFRSGIHVYGDTNNVLCGNDLAVRSKVVFSTVYDATAFSGGEALVLADLTGDTVTIVSTGPMSDGTTYFNTTIPWSSFTEDHAYVISIESGSEHDQFSDGDTMTLAEYDDAVPSTSLYTRATAAIVVNCF